jgi:protein-S-isoprenylcysteine O-methyltransferase Ste14
MHPPKLGPRGEGWVIAQFAVGAIIIGLGVPKLRRLLYGGPSRWIAALLGAALVALGLWTTGRGVRDLGTSLTPMPRPLDDAPLVETGIYATLRHPIYAGLMALCLGWAILTGSQRALAASAIEALIFLAKSSVEEEWLRARYPGYASYAAHTHRFVPGLL